MLSRRHIRVKVMQTIYAFKGDESDDLNKDQKFLLFSIEQMHKLYFLLISLLIEIQKKAERHLENTQNKHLATTEDKNPNKKLVNNELLQLLKANTQLQEAFKSHKITNWELDDEYVSVIFKALLASELYKDYMLTRTSTFKDDKYFIIDVFKEIIAPNDKLYDYIEDKNLTWIDDLPVVNTTIVKLLRKLKQNTPLDHFTPKLYKDVDDKQFALDLLNKTILNRTTIIKEIEERTQNWDTERLAYIDYVLLQMAVCELQNFPSIPIKVTINEYLEIAKEYSTPKSNIFFIWA